MTDTILLDTQKDTVPVIRLGDYGYEWTHQGHVQITNRSSETKVYSVDALNRMSCAVYLPMAVRLMACDALDWIEKNPKGSAQ